MPRGQLPIKLVQGQKVNAQTQYVGALAVNVAAVVMPILGSDGFMQEQPGLTQYGTGDGQDRGGQWNARLDMLFRVSGDSLISVDENGAITVLGTTTFSLDNPQASMAYSFNNQSIVVDGKWFLYNPVDGARRILDPEVGVPIDHVWVDGLFFFTDGDYIYHTDITNEEAINPLKFATSEFSPDKTKGVSLTTDDKVIAWNRFTTEYFENAGLEGFQFRRISSRTVQYGLVGTYCKAQIGGEWFFMGGPSESSTSIFLLQVGTAKNISSREVDQYIAKYTEAELSMCSLETRVIDTYPFLIVRLPNETLMLNFKLLEVLGASQAWTIIQSGTSATTYRAIHGVFDPRRAQWTYGDTLGPTLGYLDDSVATHYEEMVECALFTQFYYLECMSIDELMIQTIPGFTLTDDATVFASITYDGVMWSTEASLEYGGPSAYGQRFIAYALGGVENFFALKFRWVTESRMAFSSGVIKYG